MYSTCCAYPLFAIDQTACYLEKALDLDQTVIDLDFAEALARSPGDLFASAAEQAEPGRAAGFAANSN
jgi:hypothetical protein